MIGIGTQAFTVASPELDPWPIPQSLSTSETVLGQFSIPQRKLLPSLNAISFPDVLVFDCKSLPSWESNQQLPAPRPSTLSTKLSLHPIPGTPGSRLSTLSTKLSLHPIPGTPGPRLRSLSTKPSLDRIKSLTHVIMIGITKTPDYDRYH